MPRPLRVLMIEDSDFDAELLLALLSRGGYDVTHTRVETAEALRTALEENWDIVIADYNLPQFDALSALEIVKASGKDLPFLIVSGGIGESTAVAAMKAGAHDYLMKGNLARLVPVVEREVRHVDEHLLPPLHGLARRSARQIDRAGERLPYLPQQPSMVRRDGKQTEAGIQQSGRGVGLHVGFPISIECRPPDFTHSPCASQRKGEQALRQG